MRIVAALMVAFFAMVAHAERILLVPLDSRPASGQFPQLIAKIADIDVRMPPYESLGRFTNPGSPDAILDWLEKQDLSDVGTVIASADMVAYGGLIASRVGGTTEELATTRLDRLAKIVRRSPKTKLFLFSATMRLAPTATRRAAPWRMQVARYVELRERAQREGVRSMRPALNALLRQIPNGELEKYYAVRQRDERIQSRLIDMVAHGDVDYLTIGQDDAKPYGPHVSETIRLRRHMEASQVTDSVFFCEGIDQHASVLVSRALLQEAGYSPTVRVVYSDDTVRNQFDSYESRPIQESLLEQLRASGARPIDPETVSPADYTLYVNLPGSRSSQFAQFLQSIQWSVDDNLPTAVADINLSSNGMSDEALFRGLWSGSRLMKLLSYAGWNTAGNTLGTSIPAANLVMLARRLNVDPLVREVAQREFLLHRVADDYAYHRFVRPKAYSYIDLLASESGDASREETYGTSMRQVDTYVRQHLREQLDSLFREGVLGQRFTAGSREYELTGLADVRIWLPWPRAYEMRLEFRLQARTATEGMVGSLQLAPDRKQLNPIRPR